MNLADAFGNFPSRPNHPDFWRLSSVMLKLDGRMNQAKSEDEKDAVWTDNLTRWIDEDSATYTAMQRAMRPLGVQTVGDARKHAQTLVLLTVVWLEGFQVGAEVATEDEFGDRDIDSLDDIELRLLLSSYERHVMDYVEQGKKPLSVRNWYESWFGRDED